MTWTNRVAWQEGMFLRAQHFQQQDRWAESLLRGALSGMAPHRWGFTELAVDRDLLGAGRFALSAAAGTFEDGTPFATPGEADLPAPVEIAPTVRNTLVYLSLPARQPGAVEMAMDAEEGRFAARPFEAYDTQSGSPQPAELQVARLRLRILLGTDDRAGYVSIPVARIVEVTSDRRVVLDGRWIAPSLTCAASAPLSGLVVELAGLLNQRGEAIAERLNATAARSTTEVADFLLLQAVNGWQVLLSHYADAGNAHPEALYRELLVMAGQLSTFTDQRRRPASYPAYRHDDLQRSFAPVVSDIRRSLSAVLELTAVRIALQERRHGVRVGAITDRSLVAEANFVLAVQADMPTETLRRLFPGTVKIGAVEHIRELVNVALPGIALRALPVAPRQMPFIAGATYFELDRQSPHWGQMQSSGGFALHVSGDFPNLALELWAIRG
ncbi:MAG: type VI secretion system baseplate subunit TssK [Gluconacetobacter diazotrophicus]|nr:type VI secretion system baseplate subunit TssK [Gluconacetobacter diazotrophicus]